MTCAKESNYRWSRHDKWLILAMLDFNSFEWLLIILIYIKMNADSDLIKGHLHNQDSRHILLAQDWHQDNQHIGCTPLLRRG